MPAGTLLHQGSQTVPSEFMIARHHTSLSAQLHLLLQANCLTQPNALMRGRGLQESCRRAGDFGYSGAQPKA